MDLEFNVESFDSLFNDWSILQATSPCSHIFSTPDWSKVWWQHFGDGYTLYLGAVRKAGNIIGIAPLCIKDSTVFFTQGVRLPVARSLSPDGDTVVSLQASRLTPTLMHSYQ